MTVPLYRRPMDPVYPCRVLPTRHCPASYNGLCSPRRPCARYESEDPAPWLPELPPVTRSPLAFAAYLRARGHVCDGRCTCFAWGCPCDVCVPITARVDQLVTDERAQPAG